MTVDELERDRMARMLAALETRCDERAITAWINREAQAINAARDARIRELGGNFITAFPRMPEVPRR
jgi:hypothetical protein